MSVLVAQTVMAGSACVVRTCVVWWWAVQVRARGRMAWNGGRAAGARDSHVD